MEHSAIDLGRRESQICIRDDDGQILDETRYPTSALRTYLTGRPRGSRVLVESSAEAFTVADWATELGHQVRVVPSLLVPALGVGERGLKNDVRDARKLSEMDCRMAVPSVHIPSAARRAHQARLTAREALVRMRTKLINTVRSFVRMRAMAPIRATAPTLPRAVRTALLGTPEGVPDYLDALLESLEHLNTQIQQADRALSDVAHDDPVCRLLMTMPGVGPVTALSFVTALDDITRFEDARRVTSYLGLVPGERSTGFKTRRTAMTKAGPRRVRWTLTQAAWTLVRVQPDSPLGQHYERVSERRGKKIAISALTRRMASVLYAMWRDQRPYDATRAARRMR